MEQKILENKRGVLGLADMYGVALSFVLIGVVFALGLVVLGKFRDNASIAGSGAAEEAINSTISATAEIPNNWLLIVAIVVAAVLVIGLLVRNLSPGA